MRTFFCSRQGRPARSYRRATTPTASADEVCEHVRRNVEIFKPGGGYVFNNVHNIQAKVPPENVVAMYEAAYDYGFYE